MNKNDILLKHLGEGHFGLEQEQLRTTYQGELTQTKHPFINNQEVDKDFCEGQLEIITKVFDSLSDLYEDLKRIRYQVKERLALQNELLWPYSSPPIIKSVEDIKEGHDDSQENQVYRRYLTQKYGKWKMVFCGIHYNFSFNHKTLEELYWHSDYTLKQTFINDFYLQLGARIVEYSWLIVYLTAASPLLDRSYRGCSNEQLKQFASPRCSVIGFWNHFIPTLNFNHLPDYIGSIYEYLQTGLLKKTSELYYPLRFKTKSTQNTLTLLTQGIHYLELRMIDLNPLSEEGVEKKDLLFIYLLINYLATKEKTTFDEKEQIQAINNIKKAALMNSHQVAITFQQKTDQLKVHALKIINEMMEMYKDQKEEIKECLLFEKEKILHPGRCYAVIIRDQYQDAYIESGIQIGKHKP